MKEKETNYIFTDGASLGNPGPGGWGFVAIFIEESAGNHRSTVIEQGGKETKTTNNRMELQAVISALSLTAEKKKNRVTVYTDSSYVVNGITKWLSGWVSRGWITSKKESVLNRDMWEVLASLTAHIDVTWKLLPGHSGIAGNERADVVASTFAENRAPDLYEGDLKGYSYDVANLSHDDELLAAKKNKKVRSAGKAYSYLSLVDGVVMRHPTWALCEARVKGRKASFKKSHSSDDEASIVKSWGYSADDIRER